MMSRILVSIIVGLGVALGIQSWVLHGLEKDVAVLRATLETNHTTLVHLQESHLTWDRTLQEYLDAEDARTREQEQYYKELNKTLASTQSASLVLDDAVFSLLCYPQGNRGARSKYCSPSCGVSTDSTRTNP